MKRLLFIVPFFFVLTAAAQKPVIDTSVFDKSIFGKWNKLAPLAAISNDGKYTWGKTEDSLVIFSNVNAQRRVYHSVQFPVEFSADSKQILFRNSGDSLVIASLKGAVKHYISNVSGF